MNHAEMRGAYTWMVAFGLAVTMLQVAAQPAVEQCMSYEPEFEFVYKSFIRTPCFRAYLPPEVDLSARFPPPGCQGRQSSCVAVWRGT